MPDKSFSLDFPYAYGKPDGLAGFRVEPEDFQVREQLGFEPCGEGEHLYLHIEKRNENTRWVAKQIAEALSVPERDIGYCGMKDRRAVTSQWFSVHAGETPDRLDLGEGIKALTISRHQRKLRRGMHRANNFVIRLRNISGDKGEVESRLEKAAKQGVPNYFGEQRFGFDGGNLVEADKLLALAAASAGSREQGRRGRKSQKGKARQKGGIYLSAARSYLFNLILARRVFEGSWNSCLTGEQMPEGPLWGRGRSAAMPSVRELEEEVLSEWADWCHGLEFSGLQQERRPLVLQPENLSWQWLDNDLELSFCLAPGMYATAVLREISQLQVCGFEADEQHV